VERLSQSEHLADHKINRIDELLPWRFTHSAWVNTLPERLPPITTAFTSSGLRLFERVHRICGPEPSSTVLNGLIMNMLLRWGLLNPRSLSMTKAITPLRLLEAADSAKMRAALTTVYAADPGLT
jgi:hypothetical protein